MFVQNKGDWGNIFSFYWNEVKKCYHFLVCFLRLGYFLFYFIFKSSVEYYLKKRGKGLKIKAYLLSR